MESSLPTKSILVSWYADAFAALLFFSAGFYLCSQTAANPWATDLLASLGFFIIGVLIFVFCWRYYAPNLGALGYLRESYLIPHNESDSLAPGTFPGILAGIIQALEQVTLFLGFYYFQSSIGVMTCIISGASLLSAVFCYFLYKEILTFAQVVGMICCSGGLAYLAILGNTHGSTETILCGVAAAVLVSFRGMMAREAELEGISALLFTSLLCIVSSVLALVLWAVLLIVGVDVWGDVTDLQFPVIGGMAMACGLLFLTQSIMGGFTGPSISIANLTSVLVLILEHEAAGKLPVPMKIHAIVIALSGVLFMTFGDELLWLFGCNCILGRDVLEVEEQVEEVPKEMREELMKAKDQVE